MYDFKILYVCEAQIVLQKQAARGQAPHLHMEHQLPSLISIEWQGECTYHEFVTSIVLQWSLVHRYISKYELHIF